MSQKRRFLQSIRFKLLLVSLTLLTIPWAGYRYIQETERFLRQTQETMLLGTAQAVAAILHNSPAIINATDRQPGEPGETLLYVNPLDQAIQLDGYTEDWRPYLGNLQHTADPSNELFNYILGEYGNYLYLLIQVKDDQVLYQPPGSRRLDQGDYVQITIQQAYGRKIDYRITSTAPGWVTARQMSADPKDPYPSGREDRIQGEWQTSETGYTLELRIPHYLLGDRLALTVADLSNRNRPQLRRIATTGSAEGAAGLSRLIRPDPAIGRLIGGLEHENARIWVLNNQRLVLARRGQLQPPDNTEESAEDTPFSPLRLLMRLILDTPSDHFQDEFNRSARLQGKEIDAALDGKPETRRRLTPDGKAVILSAAWPIQSSRGVVGAVLVEQSTNQIVSLQNQAMENITGITLVLFLFTGLAILGFASLLTGRIRRLRNRIETAVTEDGRIQGELPADITRDEIGDLSRSFSGVLNRLSEYNRYLEAMASRLAHEFRTPLTIVKSSLENLKSDLPADGQGRYIERAQQGVDRLGLILHRMREATRLEQQLQQTEMTPFDIGKLLQMAVEGYPHAFPGITFTLDTPPQPVRLNGAPDLISQALDKLISNAVDFHQPGTAIELILSQPTPQQIRLAVRNQGPKLPEGMQQELFSSLVSIRDSKEDEPHLGLGLYLVRLIGEFHGGHAEVRNLESGTGVECALLLPGLSS